MPIFSIIIALARSTASGVPLITKFFSLWDLIRKLNRYKSYIHIYLKFVVETDLVLNFEWMGFEYMVFKKGKFFHIAFTQCTSIFKN